MAQATFPKLSTTKIDLGQKLTITLQAESTAYTHKLTATIGTNSTVLKTDAKGSYEWTVPLSYQGNVLYNNSTSTLITIKCETYNGSEKIGENSVDFYGTLPASIVPVITNVEVNDLNWDFAQGVAMLQYIVTASTPDAQGVTYSYKFNSIMSASNIYNTEFINDSGNYEMEITVTDSRGRSASTVIQTYIHPFEMPRFDFVFSRTGQIINLTVSGFQYNDDHFRDGADLHIRYRKTTETKYTTLYRDIVHGEFSVSQAINDTDIDSIYIIQVTLHDSTYGTAIMQRYTIQTEAELKYALIDFYNTGKGIALGKEAEQEGFDVGMDAVFRGSVNFRDGSIVTDSEKTTWNNKVDIQSINLTGKTASILELAQALGTAGTHHARWFSASDGGASNISDLPIAGKSFVCEAVCMRRISATDYRYHLTCYIENVAEPYVTVIRANSTGIGWHLTALKENIPSVPTKLSDLTDDVVSGKFLPYTKSLSANTNIDDITKEGVYVHDSGHCPVGTPIANTAGYLIVYNWNANAVKQEWYAMHFNRNFTRNKSTNITGTWTPWAEYITTKDMIENAFNVVKFPYYRQSGYSESGITYEYDEQGIITANGKATATSYFFLFRYTQGKLGVKPGKTYTLSLAVENGDASVYFSHIDSSGTNLGEFALRRVVNGHQKLAFEAWSDDYFGNTLGIYIAKDVTLNNCRIKVMIEEGDTTGIAYNYYFPPTKILPTKLSDLTDDIGISNTQAKVNNIGNLTTNNGTAKTLAKSVGQSLASVSLELGHTYVIYASARFVKGTVGGGRRLQLSTTDAQTTGQLLYTQDAVSINESYTYVTFSTFYTPTADTTMYLNGMQDSDTSLAAIGYLRAIKLN